MKDHGNGVTRTVSIFPQDNSLPVIQGADPAKLSKTTCMSINSASVPDISYLQKIPLDGLHEKVSSLLKNWIQHSDSGTLVSVVCAVLLESKKQLHVRSRAREFPLHVKVRKLLMLFLFSQIGSQSACKCILSSNQEARTPGVHYSWTAGLWSLSAKPLRCRDTVVFNFFKGLLPF